MRKTKAIKEDYDNIREAFTYIVADMKSLNSIVFDGRQVNIQYHLGGDWKFLTCVCGIGAANSNFACIWCTCSKAHCFKLSIWSMDDVSKGARTCELISKWSHQGKFSCKHVPLFDFIPMDRVVIDTLHLFLRISDVLTQLLIQDLR